MRITKDPLDTMPSRLKRPRQIYIDSKLWYDALETAKSQGMSLSEFIRRLLRAELQSKRLLIQNNSEKYSKGNDAYVRTH